MKQFKISDKVSDEVLVILAGTSSDLVKNAKVLNKSFRDDKAVANFIAKPEPTGVTMLVNDKQRKAMFDAISGFGMTDVATKQALCLSVLKSDIDAHVIRKGKELTRNGSLQMSTVQQTALDGALVKYRNFLVKQLMPAIEEVAKDLGVGEEVTVNEPVKAKTVE